MDISIDQIREVVSNWADSKREIKRVILFGSRARGDSTPDSDIDLALDVVGILDESAYTRYVFNKNSWKNQLRLALGRSINIVHLTEHGRFEIQASIARDGVLIYARPPA